MGVRDEFRAAANPFAPLSAAGSVSSTSVTVSVTAGTSARKSTAADFVDTGIADPNNDKITGIFAARAAASSDIQPAADFVPGKTPHPGERVGKGLKATSNATETPEAKGTGGPPVS
jgi:hypothetical protein